MIGLGGDEFTVMTGIGAHYSTNGKIEYQMGVWALYEVCALPPPVGSTLVRSWLPDAEHWTNFNRPVRRRPQSVGAELGWSFPLSPT